MGPDFTTRVRRDKMPLVMRDRWARTGKRGAAFGIAMSYAVLATVATAVALALRDGVPWVYADP